jgi:hypothetical protein
MFFGAAKDFMLFLKISGQPLRATYCVYDFRLFGQVGAGGQVLF